MLDKLRKDKKLKGALCSAGIILFLIVLWFLVSGRNDKTKKDTQYPLAVAFVDVGQGDGIVIRNGETTVVIDGGDSYSDDCITGYLKENKITSIDCYVASHPHADHIGAAERILKEFDVESVMMTSFSEINMPTTPEYEHFMNAVKDENCEVLFTGADDSFSFGELTFDVLSPREETGNYNNMSLVLRMSYRNNSFLFTGDAEAEVERDLTDRGTLLSAQVLKVGHHGSDTSTGDVFISAVAPKIAVISCGVKNDYGHPSRQTLETLEKHGIEVYRTDTQGTVTVYGDGKDVYVE